MLRTQARDAVHHRFGTLRTPDSRCCVPRLGTLYTTDSGRCTPQTRDAAYLGSGRCIPQIRDAAYSGSGRCVLRPGTLRTPGSGRCAPQARDAAYPRLGMLSTPCCGTVRGSVRLVRSKITVKICPKCKHFVLHFNSYLGVLNNYKLNSSQQTFVLSYISLISVISVPI